jgi:hypothetical protein
VAALDFPFAKPLVAPFFLCYTTGEMSGIEYFFPGGRDEEERIGMGLRRPIPVGLAEVYLTAYTEPGDRVLVPYCQGSVVVDEILSTGRQPLALHFDPLLVMLIQIERVPPPAQALNAAVARLGDSSKQGMPLRRYLMELYATSCPACLRPTAADYFVWDREQGQPVAKYVHCPACDWDGRAGLEQEDHARLAEVSKRGMHYHYILDRVTPPGEGRALRPRLEFLLELYSPRNLYALAELVLRIESLFAGEPLQRALKVLLLDCLDRCSSLASLPGSTARRRGLSRPGRFLERNVWYSFEEAAARLCAPVGKPRLALAATLEDGLSSDGTGEGCLGEGLVRDLPRVLAPRSLRLILTSPPALDSAVWSLGYLWGAWLLGAEAVSPLRPLLRQRTPDPAWYARVMAGSLRTLGSLLLDEGRLILILTGQRRTVLEALLLAASQAKLGLASLVQRGNDYRLELTPAFPQIGEPCEHPLDVQIRRASVEAATGTIRARGEPVAWLTLHASIQRRLARSGLLSRASEPSAVEELSPLDMVAEQVEAALEDPVFSPIASSESKQELWWLADPAGMAIPLSDQVEEASYEILQEALALTEVDFAGEVYRRFPGDLTPDGGLVAACLRAYGHEATPGYWQLRREDLPKAREEEQKTMVEHLRTLGRRLGYQTLVGTPFDAAWCEGQQVQAVFVVRWRAAVREALALSDQVNGARPYLVIPGGRAELASYKLAHNPLLQRAVDEAGWWFIKYRHVRQLVTQPEVDQYALRAIVGLDPVVERERAQLPLF